MPTILEEIVATKQKEIASSRKSVSEQQLQRSIADAPPIRDFFSALASQESIALIAEVKKASPSAGILRTDFNPRQIAKIYCSHGATCLSVLTDSPYFQGSLENLSAIRKDISVPLLRKDFILDQYQLLEARAYGADAVLLIAECLDDCNLKNLFNRTIDLGMTPLVEVYERENLERVLSIGATLIGINNRNLHDFTTNIDHVLKLRSEIPDDCLVVGESGIRTREDVQRLEAGKVDAMLVGESLIRSENIGNAVDILLGN
ncbi:MAG: indole-3-glycerol phosphate synthase TrpC [Pirellulales bacterium]|nr:indole-3-glycerol phosphate synthase TrpC [Pirellulales bacterium]